MMPSQIHDYLNYLLSYSDENEWLPVISTSLLLLSFCTIFFLSKSTKKQPPYTAAGYLETVRHFMDGSIPHFLLENATLLGPVFRLRMPEVTPLFAVCDPELVRFILEGDTVREIVGGEKTFHYERLQTATFGCPNMLTRNTYGSDGWDRSRKAVAPSFSYINLYKSLDKLTDRLNEFIDILHNFSRHDQTIDITSWMVKLTLDFITTSMFGINYETMKGGSEGEEFLNELSIMLKEYTLKQSFNPFRFLMFWEPEVQRAKKSLVYLKRFTTKLLEDYKSNHTNEEISADKSILGHLIRSPYTSEDQRRADLLVFLVGGHDTTAFSLAWIITEVSKNPTILQKLRQELDEVNPDVSIPFGSSHLSQLPYLERVIKEGMRLWPVGALGSMRQAPTDLIYGEFTIPKGSSIMMPFFAMFRMGIQNPHVFDPDRWIAGSQDEVRLKAMHVPFSSGKRNCVGQNLAMLEMKLVLATTFRSFEFKLEKENIECEYFLTLKPKEVLAKVVGRS